MTEKPRQHKRFGHIKHGHRNFYEEFSRADEKAKQMDSVSERLRRQAEEAERARRRDSFSYTLDYSSGGGSSNGYSSFADCMLREIEPVLHLPHERYQARRILDFI